MKLKVRVIVLGCVVFVLVISFKILEPEILGSSSRDSAGSSWVKLPVGGRSGQDIEKSTISRESVIKGLVETYKVDYKYSLKESPWLIASKWVKTRQIHPEYTPEMGAILRELTQREIVSADVGYRGTQLKLLLVLKGGQKVAFKPKWFSRNYVVTGPPYAGADRHNGEIAAFHLGRILEFRRTPLAVGRRVDLKKEIIPVAKPKLLETFFTKGNDTCFYGKCLYCHGPEDGVCADKDDMEGTIVLWLPAEFKLKLHKHPWSRTYRAGKEAKWETDDSYCQKVRKLDLYKTGPLLLDIIDTTIFDYLIGNADRHHYETFAGHNNSILLILDNAKSFGNPHHDEKSILAPLSQCCSLRFSTWQRLLALQDGILSEVFKEVLSQDPVAPVLTDEHFEALDRRLQHILIEIEHCITENGMTSIIMEAS